MSKEEQDVLEEEMRRIDERDTGKISTLDDSERNDGYPRIQIDGGHQRRNRKGG